VQHSQQASGSVLLAHGGKPESVQKAVALGVERNRALGRLMRPGSRSTASGAVSGGYGLVQLLAKSHWRSVRR
jgi:hypothetical protein